MGLIFNFKFIYSKTYCQYCNCIASTDIMIDIHYINVILNCFKYAFNVKECKNSYYNKLWLHIIYKKKKKHFFFVIAIQLIYYTEIKYPLIKSLI